MTAPSTSDSVPALGFTSDSRAVQPGDVFYFFGDERQLSFLMDAVARGAKTLVVSAELKFEDAAVSPSELVRVQNPRREYALACNSFFGNPTAEMQGFAVTGTNGKTSTCWVLAEALSRLGESCVQIGTLGMRIAGDIDERYREFRDLKNTTPDPVTTLSFLSDARRRGAGAFAMEVSSHGLVQERSTGFQWNVAVFTNLTRDHLDYHGSFESYGDAKLKLFDRDLAESKKSARTAVLNVDDPFHRRIADVCRQHGIEIVTFSTKAGADLSLRGTTFSQHGSEIIADIFGERTTIRTRLLGDYNVANTLGVVAALRSGDVSYSLGEIVEAMADVPPVPGRLESVTGRGIIAFVDYAHTPDALIRAQTSLRGLIDPSARLITVFGCGGDRDPGKRPLMARAVEELSDVAIVTSDNPRTENPAAILEQVVAGFSGDKSNFRIETELDRSAAIARAVTLARPGDVILVAGKGHETYQEVHGIRAPFSDRKVLGHLLSAP